MSTTRELNHALSIIRQDLKSATTGSGLGVKLAIVDLWCGLTPDSQGHLKPHVRTNMTSEQTTPHHFELALTLGKEGENEDVTF